MGARILAAFLVSSARLAQWTRKRRRRDSKFPRSRRHRVRHPHGVTGLEDGQWADPNFLRIVRDLGTRISIGEGETKVQNLKVVEWRR